MTGVALFLPRGHENEIYARGVHIHKVAEHVKRYGRVLDLLLGAHHRAEGLRGSVGLLALPTCTHTQGKRREDGYDSG
jgi:hypothetical protein